SVSATSTILCLEDGGFRIDHDWRLDANWRTLSATVAKHNASGRQTLRLDRSSAGWLVDGYLRPDLSSAEEPDLSVTPFCNTFPIRRVAEAGGSSLTLDVAFIDAGTMDVSLSRQTYLRKGPGRLRFVAHGRFEGFEADLTVDDEGVIVTYEHLFEQLAPQS
ncbi:MAG: putative glycolipid-binding domain-containing protein, partial [Paracoccus sp. (in: a-proteobacteria)]